MIAACIRLSRIIQEMRKDTIDGIVIITAIIEPFKIISFIVSLPDSVINKFQKNGNKNQRYFIFGQSQTELLGKLQRSIFK